MGVGALRQLRNDAFEPAAGFIKLLPPQADYAKIVHSVAMIGRQPEHPLKLLCHAYGI